MPAADANLKLPDLFGAIDRMPTPGTLLGARKFEGLYRSTGEVLAELPDMGAEETRSAIDKALYGAGWMGGVDCQGSQGHALALASADQDHTDDLAAILTAEIGKPLAEAKSEVSHAAAYLQW